MSLEEQQLKNILEAALMASGQALSIDRMLSLFLDDQQPTRDEIREALKQISEECETRGIELKQVSSGYRFQARQEYSDWVSRLWEEKPPRYSRALLETLVLIAYRQPITRGEIEEVRGVSVSTHIIKTLLEREWVRVVGHRDVPGKPALYATTKEFLDYFNMKSLEELPSLAEIRDLDKINAELDLGEPEPEEPDLDQMLKENQEAADSEGETEAAEAGEEQTVTESHAATESGVNEPESETEAAAESHETQPGAEHAESAEDMVEEDTPRERTETEAEQDEAEDIMYASHNHDDDDYHADAQTSPALMGDEPDNTSGQNVEDDEDGAKEAVSEDAENIIAIKN